LAALAVAAAVAALWGEFLAGARTREEGLLDAHFDVWLNHQPAATFWGAAAIRYPPAPVAARRAPPLDHFGRRVHEAREMGVLAVAAVLGRPCARAAAREIVVYEGAMTFGIRTDNGHMGDLAVRRRHHLPRQHLGERLDRRLLHLQ